ncbi:MAG TPA: glycosyltransferase [Tepidisphaeraceae bacterium]|jgi:GT2 family glycosyltransferase
MAASFSIIICSVNDAKFRACETMYGKLCGAGSMELVRISDARSLAEGYNRGIAQSTGEFLLLVHDDVELLDDQLRARLEQHFQHVDLIGLAGTSLVGHPMWLKAGPPYIHGQVAHPQPEGGFMVDIYGVSNRLVRDIQALDGLFLAMRRAAATQLRFDEQTFDGFHFYDMDFTFSAYQQGLRLGVACDIPVIHHSTGTFDNIWNGYATRFYRKHVAKLSPLPAKEFAWTWVKIPDRDAVRAVMTHPWDD